MSDLPDISGRTNKNGLQIPLTTSVSFKSINAQIKKSFKSTEIELKGRKINITKIKLIGGKDGKAIFAVNFNGWREGIIYLTGKPVYIEAEKTVKFEDLDFELETKSVLLKTAKWLFNKKLASEIQSKLKFSLESTLKKATTEADKAMNQTFQMKGYGALKLKGNINKIEIQEVAILKEALEFLVIFNGELSATF